ncbi:MAG: ABC transporter ATP-binding protein, partial [Clostridia bacterium]
QKPYIFDMSIRENLNLVDTNKNNQIESCKKAGIHDYIMNLKDGYNTKLVSDAENISTGQKQLISLARTLLSKSEVLLFDEVTSSLDLNTSKEIMNILKELKKNHTVLMITHKPELMKLADEIIVIDNGKLVGRGVHRDLIENNKYYQNLQK